jgi:diguanylate cyclase (GGDEF)-like protein/PAS domain S-box-containing protein
MTTDNDTGYGVGTSAGDDMVCVIDRDQTCLSVNGAFLQAFGKQEKELIGQCATDPGGQDSFAGLIEESLSRALAGDTVETQRWWDFPCLGFRFIRIRLEPLPDGDGDGAGAIGAVTVCVRDLTDARLAQEALEDSEQRFEDFAEIVSDWLWELDEELRFVYLSARFEEIMGMSMEQVLGRRRKELFPEEDQAAAATRNHHLDLEQRRPFDDYQFTRILDDGAKRSMRMSGRPIFDHHGRFRGYRGVARDATDARHMESRIAHLKSHDLLTGLVNRQEFLQRLQRVVDATGTEGSEHGLCYVDVDRFRAINNRCGHPAGDQLLMEIADLLREQIRRRDTLARVGGNAFAILMEHCSLTQIERVAEAVHRAIGAYRFARYDQTINVTATIGVVPIGSHSRSIDQVLKAADQVCYAAKSAGGDRILVYGRPDRSAARERRGLDMAPAGH